MNNYRKKNYRGKRGYGGRPHRRTADSYHQPLPNDQNRIPYARHTLTKPDVESVVDALLSGTLTQGRELERFEGLLAKLTHSDYAVAVNSGTAAIHAALACLKLEPGDEVITSTLNFSSVTNMIKLVGATPILVDCDPETLTMSADAARAVVNENTKAILTNNFAGHPSDMVALREICEEHGLWLVEDAAHGLGGKHRGHYVGNQADLTCFSFHPSKAITTCEGGAITTNNRSLSDRLRQFRHHGIQKDPRHFQSEGPNPPFWQELQFPGMNYRLSEVHAALGRSQLTRLDRHIERRRAIAQVYFQKLERLTKVKLPHVAEWADSAFHIFPVQLMDELEEKRDVIFERLVEAGIDVQFHYIPVHRMPLYAPNHDPADFPNAEAYFRRGLTLPLFPDLSYKDIERIIDTFSNLVEEYLPESDQPAPREDHDAGAADADFGDVADDVVDEGSADDAGDMDDDAMDTFDGTADDTIVHEAPAEPEGWDIPEPPSDTSMSFDMPEEPAPLERPKKKVGGRLRTVPKDVPEEAPAAETAEAASEDKPAEEEAKPKRTRRTRRTTKKAEKPAEAPAETVEAAPAAEPVEAEAPAAEPAASEEPAAEEEKPAKKPAKPRATRRRSTPRKTTAKSKDDEDKPKTTRRRTTRKPKADSESGKDEKSSSEPSGDSE